MDNDGKAFSQGETHQFRWVWIILVLVLTLGLWWVIFKPLSTRAAAIIAGQQGIIAGSVNGYQRDNLHSDQPELYSQPFDISQAVLDLSITKTHQEDFEIGSSGVYSISVSNIGTDVISGSITVTDILTDVLSPVGVSANGWDPCGFTGQTVTCVYSNTAGVGPGVDLPLIRLIVEVNPASTPQIINTATVANLNDTNPSNNVANDPTNLIGADLDVTKTILPPSAAEGSVITYTVTLTNQGPSQATGVVLTDTLPSGITFASALASQGSYSNATGRWTVGSLNNGAAATLRLRATVNSGTKGDTITNVVNNVTSDVPDYNPDNNTASAGITIQSTQVTGLVTNAITDDPISGAVVQLQDSANVVHTYNTTSTGWYTFTSTITNPIAAGSATIRASKTSYASKSFTLFLLQNQNTRQDFALDTTDLAVTKSDGRSTVVPGQTITYTMVISNVGTIPAASVVITDVLPTYLTYITDTLGITHSVPVAHTYVWKLANNIDPNKAVRFNLRVSVADALPSPSTALTNQVRATTESPEANTTNNIGQDTNTSTGTPTPNITISVSPNQVRTNQNATYTIKVSNTGSAPMTDVAVNDTFSSFLDISSAKTTKGTATTNSSSRKVTVAVSVLDPGEDFTITVVTRVNTSATTNTTVTNSATLTYRFGGSNFTRTSNSVSFQLLVSSTLPGTGGIELTNQRSNSQAYLLAFISALLLFVLGLMAIVFSIRSRRTQSEWASWAIRMGALLLCASVLFAVSGWVLYRYIQRLDQPVAALQSSPQARLDKDRALSSDPEDLIWPGVTPQIPGSELDKLPDFPIPTPTVSAAPDGKEDGLDISPVNRILIPAIALDTIVKYVPFDGLTWLIAGLHQEVAWMGDTSWPGLGSNTALAGHVTLRDGSNGPFRYISDLQKGDAVFVYTDENVYQYNVHDQVKVEETEMSVVEKSTEPMLTLITCTDWDSSTGFYTKRLIVHAELTGVKPIKELTQGN